MTTKALIRFATPGSNPEHGDWQLVDWPPVGALPTGFIQGLVPRNPSGGGSDPTNDITFGVGIARDSTDAANLKATSEITKRADAAWAAGTGNGGMASGVSWGANSFHLHALGKSTDADAIDFIFDTSVTAANALADSNVIAAGFDLYRRVGSLKTAGAAWPTFSAEEANGGGLDVLLVDPSGATIKDWSVVDDSAQTETLANVPAGVVLRVSLYRTFHDASVATASFLRYSALAQTDIAAGSNACHLAITNIGGGNSYASGPVFVRTNTSAQVRYRATNTTADHNLYGTTEGWLDFRRS